MKIGIAGAGIVGRLLALKLLQQGHHVTLFDKTHANDLTTTSHVAAGLLSPWSEIQSGMHEIVHLASDALDRWQDVISCLDVIPRFSANGSIMIAPNNALDDLHHFVMRANRIGLHFEILDDVKFTALEPELRASMRPYNAIYLKNEGHINVTETMQALAVTLHSLDVIWHEQTLVKEIIDNTVMTDHQHIQFDVVFDCRGLGSTISSLRAVRGELMELYAPNITIHHPIRLLHPRYPLYLVPQNNHSFTIGATMIEVEDYSTISVQSSMELLSACMSIHPGFSEARIISSRTQCRPAFQDNLPRIIQTKDCIHINGMYRHGFLLGPLLAQQASDLITGEVYANHLE